MNLRKSDKPKEIQTVRTPKKWELEDNSIIIYHNNGKDTFRISILNSYILDKGDIIHCKLCGYSSHKIESVTFIHALGPVCQDCADMILSKLKYIRYEINNGLIL